MDAARRRGHRRRRAGGLDPAQLQQALEDGHIAERVRHDFMGGVRSGVNGTPSFYLDGRLYEGGFDTLGQAVQRRVAQAG